MKNNIKIALVQADLLWQNTEGNLEKFDILLQDVDKDTDVVILPEMFATAFTMDVDKLEKPIGHTAFEWLKNKAHSLDKILVGSLLYEVENKYYNRMFWMRPDGSFSFYDKRHLFRMGNEDKVMTAGNKRVIIPFKGMKFMLQVCYDLRFPVWVKNNYNKTTKSFDYDALIYIANWPAIRKQAYLKLLKARAIENLAYVVWVNRVGSDNKDTTFTGNSQIVDPFGNIISQLPEYQEGILYEKLDINALQETRNNFEVGLDWDAFEVNPKNS